MRKPGPISIFTTLIILVIFLTFCDKKKELSPAPAETSQTNDNTSATPGISITPIESTTTTAINSGTTSSTTSTSSTSSTTTGKDAGISPETSSAGTQNTTLQVSTTLPGWTFDPCLLNPLTLTGTNGLTVVTLTFGSLITTGNYTLTSGIPGPGQVRMTVLDPPGQPVGSTWVSKTGGSVSVNVGTSSTVAAFTGVQCTQPLFPYPIVTVSGDVGCQ
jgi:hypothetical protein